MKRMTKDQKAAIREGLRCYWSPGVIANVVDVPLKDVERFIKEEDLGPVVGMEGLEWIHEAGRTPSDLFAFFTNSEGERWAFLYRPDEIRLSGSAIKWAVEVRSGEILHRISYKGVRAIVPDHVPLDHPEVLWVSSCLLVAADYRYKLQGKGLLSKKRGMGT